MNGVGVWRSYTPPMACSAMALSMSVSAAVSEEGGARSERLCVHPTPHLAK